MINFQTVFFIIVPAAYRRHHQGYYGPSLLASNGGSIDLLKIRQQVQ